jgi:hypothetical protein
LIDFALYSVGFVLAQCRANCGKHPSSEAKEGQQFENHLHLKGLVSLRNFVNLQPRADSKKERVKSIPKSGLIA